MKHVSYDAAEGILSFLQRRDPQWTAEVPKACRTTCPGGQNRENPEAARRARPLPSSGVQVYEIRIAGGEDALKERVERMLCPDEHHPPPCPVPWSPGYGDGTLVLAIYADRETAEDVAERVRARTPHPVTLADGHPAGHEELVEQYRIERR